MLTPFAIDYDALRVALVAAVRLATGLPQNGVIMAEPEVANAPRPERPYITLKVMVGAQRYGYDQVEQPDPASTQRIYAGPRSMSVSFNAYANSHEQAHGILSTWQAALGTEPVCDLLRTVGIAVWQPGAVNDLSLLLNAGFEGRAQMDGLFGLTSRITVDVGQIDTVPVSGNVDAATASATQVAFIGKGP